MKMNLIDKLVLSGLLDKVGKPDSMIAFPIYFTIFYLSIDSCRSTCVAILKQYMDKMTDIREYVNFIY